MKRAGMWLVARAEPVAVLVGLVLIVVASYRVDDTLGMLVAGVMLVAAGSNWRAGR